MKQIFNKESFELLLYFTLAIIGNYILPIPLNTISILAIFPIIWKTKRDYFWLAFLFLLEDSPGGFFAINAGGEVKHMPTYAILPGFKLFLTELLVILFFIKTFSKESYKKIKSHTFFAGYLHFFLGLFITLVIITPFLEADYMIYREMFKIAIYLTLFYSMFKIIPDYTTLIKFFSLLFPFSLLAILMQFYSLNNGHQLIVGLIPGTENTQGVLGDAEVERPIEMVHILLLNFIGTLFLINEKVNNSNKNYLWIINVISFISILMTGTRAWFIAFLISYIYFLLISRISSAKLLLNAIVMIILVIGSTFLIPVLSKQIDNAWSRLETIELFLKGDITGGGTVIRFNERAPIVWDAFMESTIIFGAGFGKLHHEKQDFHIGYHNILLNTGLIGAFGFLSFFFYLVLTLFQNYQNKTFAVAFIAILILLILNATTQYIGFNVYLNSRFLIQAFVVVFISISYSYGKRSLE